MSAAAVTNIEIADSRPGWAQKYREPSSALRPMSLLAADLAGLSLAAALISRTLDAHFSVHVSGSSFAPFMAIVFALFCASGLYRAPAASPVIELRKLICSTCLAALTIACLGPTSSDSRVVIARIAWLAAGMPLVAVLRPLVRSVMIRSGHWLTPTVVIGSGVHADRLLGILEKHKYLGFRPVAILDDLGASSNRYSATVLRRNISEAAAVAQEYGITHAIVADPDTETNGLRDVASQFTGCFKDVLFIRDYTGIGSLSASTADLGGLFGLQVSQNLLDRWHRLPKRIIDTSLAGLAATAALPIFGAVYVAIRMTSAGPVFYSQVRVGRNGQFFKAWKFRSMVTNADEVLRNHLEQNPELRREWDLTQKLRNDPRVLPVGRFIRKTSLDELPQLWNVLRGDMSLVGPRPIIKGEVVRYGEYFNLYKMVRPGITGMWQISGRSNTSYEERISFDKYYVKNWSVWLDLYILFRTIKTVFLLEGAC
ncbi:MAG: undecaprenyl-phosphate galactose phosphotransferase WbaP [Bryobacteraceae bacterium]